MESLYNKTLLIVDDTKGNIDLLVAILKNDYRLKIATTGEKAIEIAQYEPVPDLILLDIMMPGIDGYEVCRHLQKDEMTRDIPVIFLTAKADTKDETKGLQLGAVDYITKPINPDILKVRIKTHLQLKQNKDTISKISQEQKELIHILCHDLLNPIGFVVSILEMSKDTPEFWEEMKGHIEAAMNNSMEMINLVRTIVALDENKVELELKPHSLDLLLHDSISIIQSKLSEKNLQLNVQIDKNITIYVERTSFINSVINNILTNAIKFSFPNSEIYISTSAHKHKDFITLSVRDYGIGMPESLIKNIFSTSKPTTRKGTKGEQGTGFGMPLVKKFISHYGGNISISSREQKVSLDDHGTEIILDLPLCKPETYIDEEKLSYSLISS